MISSSGKYRVLCAFLDSKEVLNAYQTTDIDPHTMSDHAVSIRSIKDDAQVTLEILEPTQVIKNETSMLSGA